MKRKLIAGFMAMMLIANMVPAVANAAENKAGIAKIGDVSYKTLEEAVDKAKDGDKIILQSDCEGNGIVINKDITIDFNGYTYEISGKCVGSSGTKSNGFQLLKDNDIVLMNGSIIDSTEKAKILIQNYSDLTVTNMQLGADVSPVSDLDYVLSNNNGTVLINGETYIHAEKGTVALDVYDYRSQNYSGVNVTIDGAVIGGMIEVGGDGKTPDPMLTVKKATIDSDMDGIVATSGKVIIEDAKIDAGTDNDGSYCAVWANGGDFTIYDGEFFNGADEKGNGNDLIYTKNGGTVKIYGGIYSTAALSTSFGVKQYSLLNMNDKSGGEIVVYGGEFYKFNPADNASENPKVNFVAPGYELASESDEEFYYVGLHKIVHVEKEEPCCMYGFEEYWTCDTCDVIYADEECKTTTTLDELKIKEKGHNYGEYLFDEDGHWKECSCDCGYNSCKTETEEHDLDSDGNCKVCDYPKKEADSGSGTPSSPGSSSGSSDSSSDKEDEDDESGKVMEYYPAPKQESAAQTAPAQTVKPSNTVSSQTKTETKVEEEAVEVTEDGDSEKAEIDTSIIYETATEEVKELVKEEVKVEESTATVTAEVIDKIMESNDEGSSVILPLNETVAEETVKTAAVPVESLEKIAEKEVSLTVEFSDTKVTFDTETLKAIAEAADGENVEIRVALVAYEELLEEQQEVLEEYDVAVCISAQIYSNGEYIGDFEGGKARIAIPFELEDGKVIEDHSVFYVSDAGEMTEMPFVYEDGYIIIETDHFSDFVIAAKSVAEEVIIESEEEAPVEEEKKSSLPVISLIVAIVALIVVVASNKRAEENRKKAIKVASERVAKKKEDDISVIDIADEEK